MTTLLARRLIVVGAATVAALGAYLILHRLAGVDLAVRHGASVNHVQAAAVAATALVAALAGWGFLALLERMTARPRAPWYIVATVVFLLSLLGPLGGVTGSAKLALAALHLTVAVIVIFGLPRGSHA
jgi:hypothetical protein